MSLSQVEWERGKRIGVVCLTCGEVVFSRVSGQFVMCTCEKVYVDQNPYYCRVGGNFEDLSYTDIKLDAEYNIIG